jgi:AraC-like DNA-binding protein
MRTSLLLDQPDLIAPTRSRRARSGDGPRIQILNARGARYDGGGDEPDLSLKWIPAGAARYRSGRNTFELSGEGQLLLNRGQPYELSMRTPSESFVVFFAKEIADAAWSSFSGRFEPFPEVPAVAGLSPKSLLQTLTRLRAVARQADADLAALEEGALALLDEIAALGHERRRMATRLPAIRRTTRDELLRRAARAERYLIETGAAATLEGAAAAAALSSFHLIRVFRAAFGETPLAFGAARRLEAARDTLILTADSVEEIALRAGYESRTAFDRAFRRRFGTTPGALRATRH